MPDDAANSITAAQPMIAKTRRGSGTRAPAHDAPAAAQAPAPRDVGQPRGVLRSKPATGSFHYARHAPSEMLQPWLQHFWMVRWDLRGRAPQLRETLPHPNMHLIFERGLTRIFGVHTARFSRALEGEGCVFGVKFRAGGFHPFLRRPLASVTDRSVSLHEIFGDSCGHLEEHVFGCNDEIGMIDVVTEFLATCLPAPDPNIDLAAAIVDRIAVERDLTSVAAIVERCGISKRALQRLFSEYVGVSPKWVINRYRIHEAIEQLASGRVIEWSAFALELGYFDQAHFIRDFKKLVGCTPTQYMRTSDSREDTPALRIDADE